MDNKERNVSFATMVSTGEKPDAEIHIVGFDEGDGCNAVIKMEGQLGASMHLVAAVVGDMCRITKDEGGMIAQMEFVDAIARQLCEHVDKSTMKFLALKSAIGNPEDMLKDLEGFKDELGIEDEEDGAGDAEPV